MDVRVVDIIEVDDDKGLDTGGVNNMDGTVGRGCCWYATIFDFKVLSTVLELVGGGFEKMDNAFCNG